MWDAVVIVGLLLVLGLLLIRPRRWLEGQEGTLKPLGWGQVVTYFAFGVYAGMVVLGSGFFILATLVLLTGCDLRACADRRVANVTMVDGKPI